MTLTDARAFSSSLGLTARGTIDLDLERATLDGTIVPAYFFNSLLGNIPLVGRLFSPEQGGGLFAANYAVRGKLDNPDVTINPLAALTPGFLRGLFGLFLSAFAGRLRPRRSRAGWSSCFEPRDATLDPIDRIDFGHSYRVPIASS